VQQNPGGRIQQTCNAGRNAVQQAGERRIHRTTVETRQVHPERQAGGILPEHPGRTVAGAAGRQQQKRQAEPTQTQQAVTQAGRNPGKSTVVES